MNMREGEDVGCKRANAETLELSLSDECSVCTIMRSMKETKYSPWNDLERKTECAVDGKQASRVEINYNIYFLVGRSWQRTGSDMVCKVANDFFK